MPLLLTDGDVIAHVTACGVHRQTNISYICTASALQTLRSSTQEQQRQGNTPFAVDLRGNKKQSFDSPSSCQEYNQKYLY